VKDNPRFVVTNRARLSPENTYAWYCERGESENRIKEVKLDLSIDRTSCSRFVANQFRMLMTAACSCARAFFVPVVAVAVAVIVAEIVIAGRLGVRALSGAALAAPQV